MEVKIGVQHAAREINVETTASSEEVANAVSQALTESQPLISFEDERGRKVLVPTDKLTYVEIGEPEARRVGFGAM